MNVDDMTSWFCKKVETLVFHNLGQLFGLCDCALCFFGEERYAIEPRPFDISYEHCSEFYRVPLT